MRLSLLLLILGVFHAIQTCSQCNTCGNGINDSGETFINCPSDIPHPSTCASPCSQSASFETNTGIRIAHDFTGTTTYSTTGLPAGWTFAGAPSATTAGALPAADGYGAKAGLVQPNCSGSCTSTNGFCIGNIANSVAVGAGGTSGKLGANFDGRNNINQNLSYAVLRGQGSPTLVSETYNFSGVEGFKIQFWLCASESSCGQTNGWGSCVGNTAFLDFSSNGGTSWTQIMQMNNSSTSNDMCTSNSTNTFWIQEGTWSRVCLTVYKTANSPGNFYSAASAGTAASGMMVNSAYFTSNFKFRIRYSQTASCTSGITTTNPGRYLAIDYPVVTSGNQMIPCGISFAQTCGFGEDTNDDGVGSSTGTATATAHGIVKRGENFAEKGVEIFHAQNATFSSLNATGTSFPSDFTLCNAEGGDAQCIDWRTNNNSYFVQYECITDWEAPSGTIAVGYYKSGVAQSFNLTKVTTAGKTALIGWRHSGSRFVNCSSTSDLNVGCNGYLFRSASLPTQFIRAFYQLSVNNLGQSWSFYGPTSCSNYFNGPFIGSIAVPTSLPASPNFTVCSGSDLVFTGALDFCISSSGITGTPGLSITGPSGYTDFITNGGTGLSPITIPGDYTIQGNIGNSPAQCLDCGRNVCITVTQAEIDACATALPVTISLFQGEQINQEIALSWITESEINSSFFRVQHWNESGSVTELGTVKAAGNSNTPISYSFNDPSPELGMNYYQLILTDKNGIEKSNKLVSVSFKEPITCNFLEGIGIKISGLTKEESFTLLDIHGKIISKGIVSAENNMIAIQSLPASIYYLEFFDAQLNKSQRLKLVVN